MEHWKLRKQQSSATMSRSEVEGTAEEAGCSKIAFYSGLLTPAFVACSTNAGVRWPGYPATVQVQGRLDENTIKRCVIRDEQRKQRLWTCMW